MTLALVVSALVLTGSPDLPLNAAELLSISGNFTIKVSVQITVFLFWISSFLMLQILFGCAAGFSWCNTY